MLQLKQIYQSALLDVQSVLVYSFKYGSGGDLLELDGKDFQSFLNNISLTKVEKEGNDQHESVIAKHWVS